MKKIALQITVKKLLLIMALLCVVILYKDVKAVSNEGFHQQRESSQVSRYTELCNKFPLPFLIIIKII